MKKIVFGTTALLLTLVALGAVSPQRAAAQDKTGGASKASESAQLVVDFDLNKAIDEIVGAINAEKNREAWVRALLEQTRSRTKGKVNVMVFNLQQSFEFNPPNGTFKFKQATFDGGAGGKITYGVWIFHSPGVFKNKGDGGFINWAFYGSFHRDGGTVTFSDGAVFSGSDPKAPKPQIDGPKIDRPSEQKRM
jgi:hypothetical protein